MQNDVQKMTIEQRMKSGTPKARGQGDKGTREQGNKGTRGQGDKGALVIVWAIGH